jgi:two-component system nitrogen regulation response regulator GlnG
MSDFNLLPRILIVDDRFGRIHPDRKNEERANLCRQYLLEDVTFDEIGNGTGQKIKKPVAQVVFCRGQRPVCSTIGDTVENDLAGTLEVIRKGWQTWQPNKPRWAMVLLDLCFYTGPVTEESERERGLGMPLGRDGDDNPQHYFGLQLLRAIFHEFSELPVVILSSKPRQKVSLALSCSGAYDFLKRDDEQGAERLQQCLYYDGFIADSTRKIIGHSKALLLALRAARRAASTQKNLLIRGERGTGKELLAEFLHQQRQKNCLTKIPFIAVNSAILTKELYASELFGIKKKVATGVDERIGLIKEASGGDLFLDEIKDMPPQVQAGVLRVLQNHQMTPVGATTPQTIDVRFISATNADIEALVAANQFRADLRDRLINGGTIDLPPLRDRKEDIPTLVETFVRQAESENPRARQREIEPDAVNKLCTYDWPGNIRELRSCIYRAVDNYPRVEHLAPIHIQLSEEADMSKNTVYVQQASVSIQPETHQVPSVSVGNHAIVNMNELIQFLNEFSFDSASVVELHGQLGELRAACARLLARYVIAALKIRNKNPTPTHPFGEPNIEGAMKLMTGNQRLNQTKPARLLKRLLKIDQEGIKTLVLSEPLLKKAAERVGLFFETEKKE